jgi:hypothetical protein
MYAYKLTNFTIFVKPIQCIYEKNYIIIVTIFFSALFSQKASFWKINRRNWRIIVGVNVLEKGTTNGTSTDF